MAVRINNAGRHPAAAGVDDARGSAIKMLADGDDLAVTAQYVGIIEAVSRAIEHGGVGNQQVLAGQGPVGAGIAAEHEGYGRGGHIPVVRAFVMRGFSARWLTVRTRPGAGAGRVNKRQGEQGHPRRAKKAFHETAPDHLFETKHNA